MYVHMSTLGGSQHELRMLLSQTETSRETSQERNNHQQEQSAYKRGPEENHDDYSSEGNFEVKSFQRCWLCREIAHTKNLSDTKYNPQNLWKKCVHSSRRMVTTMQV